MTTHKRISSLLLTAVCSLALAAIAGPAMAGFGGTFGKIQNAIDTGNEDAIITALEQAEDIPCSSECMYAVRDLLDDDRYGVREVAAWWFARRPAQKSVLLAESIATLAATTSSTDARNAADVLGTFRLPNGVPALSGAIGRADLSAEARAHVARALGTIGHPGANPALASAMTDADPFVRYEAVRAWSSVRHQASTPALVALVDDADPVVRRAAISVVGSFADASARSALENVLATSDDPVSRRNAAWALGKIGDSASRGVLTRAIGDSSSLVRMTASTAIRSLK